MRLKSIAARPLAIPFNVAFRHASAERSATQAIWVTARAADGVTGYGEGCPREYVTSETVDSARAFVSAHAATWVNEVRDAQTLSGWVKRCRDAIDVNPAAWTAIEIALLDLLGKAEGKSVEAVLGLPELSGTFRYTAVLGDAPPPQFEAQLRHYLKAGFGMFKIKLTGERARDQAKVRALAAAGINARMVRADANNLWRDASSAIRTLEALAFPFFAIEEPLAPGDYAGMSEISAALDTRIILDESLLRADQLTKLQGAPERWIVNLRVSKMGGVLRSLELLDALRRREIRVVVGAHVGETSVLTRAALTVAGRAGDLLLAQEGAFGTHLLAHDVVAAPVMFGAGGVLDTATLDLTPHGFGLSVVAPPQPGVG